MSIREMSSSTLDDRTFRKLISDLLGDLAEKVDQKRVDAVEWSAARASDDGYVIFEIAFKVRKS
jgi:hypothetical protein